MHTSEVTLYPIKKKIDWNIIPGPGGNLDQGKVLGKGGNNEDTPT